MDYFASELASRANEIARDILTPGDTFLKKHLCQSLSLSERETAKPPHPPSIQHPQAHVGSLCSRSHQLCPAHHAGELEAGGIWVTCGSASWYPWPQVLWQDSSRWQLPSHWEDTTLDENRLFAVESSIILSRGVTQEHSSRQHVLHRQSTGQPFRDQVSLAQGMALLS